MEPDMENKIIVEICTGTACYVLGASELLDLEYSLSEEQKERVEIIGMPCQGYCKDIPQNPPFVRINGKVFGEISLDHLLDLINEIINKEL